MMMIRRRRNTDLIIKELQKINNDYLNKLKHDYERNKNRKSKKTKEEMKEEIKNQISFLFWSAIMAFFATSIFWGFDHLYEGLKKIVTTGECIPTMSGIYYNPNDVTNLGLGESGDKFINHSVCAIFRNSLKTLYSGLVSGNPFEIASVFIKGPLLLPLFPGALRRSIDYAVDTLFKSFEDPDYAKDVNAKAKREIVERDREFKESGQQGFGLIGDEEDDEEDDEDDESESESETETETRRSYKAVEKIKSEAEKEVSMAEKEVSMAEKQVSIAEKQVSEAKVRRSERLRGKLHSSERASSERASSQRQRKAAERASSERQRKAAERASEKQRKAAERASEKQRKAAERASEKQRKDAERALKKQKQAEEKLRKAEERKQAAELKKSIKLANLAAKKAASSAASRRTRKVKITPVLAATNRPMRVVSIDGIGKSPPITKEQFDQNLKNLGVYNDYYNSVRQLTKRCAVKDLRGGDPTGGILTAFLTSKLALATLYAGGWAAFNWNAMGTAYNNYQYNVNSPLLEMPWTNFGLNILGIGVPPECKGGFFGVLGSYVFSNVSIAGVFTMSVLFAENYENTFSWFVDYAAKIISNVQGDYY